MEIILSNGAVINTDAMQCALPKDGYKLGLVISFRSGHYNYVTLNTEKLIREFYSALGARVMFKHGLIHSVRPNAKTKYRST